MTGATTTGFNSSAVATDQEVTVTVAGKTVTFNVTIEAAPEVLGEAFTEVVSATGDTAILTFTEGLGAGTTVDSAVLNIASSSTTADTVAIDGIATSGDTLTIKFVENPVIATEDTISIVVTREGNIEETYTVSYDTDSNKWIIIREEDTTAL